VTIADVTGQGTSLAGMEDRPPPDPVKLLEHWMEWERGETPPGKVISNLKTGGMRELLEGLASPHPTTGADAGG
jgi:hypothetical protein